MISAEYFCEILRKFDRFSHMKACPEEKSQQQSVWSVVPRFFNIYSLSPSTKTETRPAEGRLVTSSGGINARNSWESYCETNENNAHIICFLAPQKILLLTWSPRCSYCSVLSSLISFLTLDCALDPPSAISSVFLREFLLFFLSLDQQQMIRGC